MRSRFGAGGSEWRSLYHSLDPENKDLIRLQKQETMAVRELTLSFTSSTSRATSSYSKYAEGSGLTVDGTSIQAALVDGYLKELYGSMSVEGSGEVAEGALLRLHSQHGDNWIGLATFPGYEAVVTVRETSTEDESPLRSRAELLPEERMPWWCVDQVAYLPLPEMPVKVSGGELASCIAQISAEIQLGIFDPSVVPEATPTALWEDLNPTLAVLCAHEWSNIGRVDLIDLLIKKFEAQKRAVPFDLPVLVGKPWERVDTTVVPGFPLLMRGWAIAESIPADQSIFEEALNCRVPSFWASFRNLSYDAAAGLAAATTHSAARAYA